MLQRAQQQRQQSVPAVRIPRPAVPLAVSFLLGVLGHDLLPPHPGWWLVATASLVLLALLTLRRDVSCCLCLIAALALAGATAGQIETSFYPPAEIGLFTAADRQLVQLELTLDDPPRLTTAPQQGQRPSTPRQLTRGTARRILTTSGWQPATGTLLVHIEPPNPHLTGGETVRATGWLDRFSPPMNPGQFDFADYYRRQRILATFSIRRSENLQVLAAAPKFAPLMFLRAKSRALLDAGFTDARAVDRALLRALLLGDNDPLLRDIQDLFVRTGTSHHLSISGLHVAVLAGFVYFLCRVARLAPRKTAYITLAFVFLYGLAALPNPPVVRSVLLCTLVIVGTLFRRTSDLIQLLALSVFGMLVYSPLDLYDVGFELSFGTVLGLMLFTRPLPELFFPVDPDMALAPKKKQTRLGRWLRNRVHSLRDACFAAVVAWFVSLPMILHHFDRLNPWATLASVALAPLVFLSLITGLLKIVFTLICPPLAWLWADIAALPIAGMRHGVDWLARLPGSDYPLHPIPVPVMLLYYAALCAALLPAIPRRIRQLMVIAACVTVLAVPFALTAVAHHHPDETRVTILSVGAGSCAVVETDNGQTLLIDAGSTGSSDLYRSIIEPYLRTRGLRHVDAAFISHADFDHYGALADVARTAGVGRTYFTPQFSRDAEDSHAAKSLLLTLKQLDTPTDTLSAGRSIRLSPDTTLDVLWPPPDATDVSTNDSSMVLRLSVAGRSVLFPGDIQSFAMDGLLANPAALRSDVLVAPHHGSLEDATPAFVGAVAPSYIVSSDDSTPSHKQRDFDATITGRPLLHTHECGAVTITIGRDGTLAVTPFRSRSSAAAPANPAIPPAAPAIAAP